MNLRKTLLAVAGTTLLSSALSSCTLYGEPAQDAMDHSTMDMSGESKGDHGDHDGQAHMHASGDGLDESLNGFSLKDVRVVPSGTEQLIEFRVTNIDGAPHTKYARENGQLMHLLVMNQDLSKFTHLHPNMDASGLWKANASDLGPGPQHLVMQFVALDREGTETGLILGSDAELEGSAPNGKLEAPANEFKVDGLTAALKGTPKVGADAEMVTTITKAGKPAALVPYLENWLHITAINADTKAVTHTHPDLEASEGAAAPKQIPWKVNLPEAGTYLIVIEFATEDGKVHTSRFVRTVK